MLRRLVELSLRHRGVVMALAGGLIAYGLYAAWRARLDVFPEFAPPQVVIQTEAPGLAAEEVEQLVTRPIETALSGAPDLETLRSQSIQGLSAVTVVFKERADIFRARQLVSERLTQLAGELPQGVQPPKLGPLTSTTGTFLVLGLTSTNRTPMELRTFADWTLRPRLLGVPGVAKADTFGGEVRQLQVQVKPEKLLAFGLALDDVLAAARKSTGVRGAGFIENANQRVIVRTEGQALTPEALGDVVLAPHDGVSVRLKDVAAVVEGPEPKFGDAQIMGQRGVILVLRSQYGANTLEVTRAVERTLAELAPAFATEQMVLHPRLFRPANFIEAALGNLRASLLLGGALVAAVLWVFLLDWRTAFISFLSIPLSLLTAVIVLDRCGVTLNTLTLGGLAIAIGVVVDDAIIDVENILRRVRQRLRAAGEDARAALFSVVLAASLEVRSAVVYATFIVALVFVPVLAMSGVAGRLFAPLATSFILATLASLAVALTVTPALCYALLARVDAHTEPRWLGWLKQHHRRWLEGLSRHPRAVIALAAALCLGAAATVPFFGGEFLPEFREGHFIVHMIAYPGTSLEESLRLGGRVTAELLRNPHIKSVSQQAGRAENGEDTWGPHMSELHVELQPLKGEAAEAVLAEIRESLGRFPGVTFKVMPFLAERIEETISGAGAQVVVKLVGEDLDLLDQKAEAVRQVLAGVRGATDVQMEFQPGGPELVVRLRRERLRLFGFQPVEVLETVQAAFQGVEVAQAFQGNRFVDVTVLLDPASRRDPEQVGALLVQNPAGTRLPLRELADIQLGTGRSMVVHEGTLRRQQVTCNVHRRDVASFIAEAKKRILEQVSFSPGVAPVFTGSAEAQAATRLELLAHAAGAGAGIGLLLALVFRSGRNLLLVLANLPFALVGGVLAVFASGGALSIGSLVGFVTLFGITMRNSIMMISHCEHLVTQEGLSWGLDAAVRGASERLVPILMTALVTALGLLPLALVTGEAGGEIEGPMALVILGGLLTSTALNLLVLPTLALRFARFRVAVKR
jgi:CzcA family heavy metal efflux pump